MTLDEFIEDAFSNQGALVQEAATRLGLQAHVVEKDLWVSWMLRCLFHQLPDLGVRMLFKGGTTLSKGYGCIKRFSEDIDLALEKSDLGNDMPVGPASNTKINKASKALALKANEFTKGPLYEAVNAVLLEHFKDFKWALSIENDGGVLAFVYPKLLAPENYFENNYVKPKIIVETGGRAELNPYDKLKIGILVNQAIPDVCADELIIPSLSMGRTFWEKVTFVHSLNQIGRPEKVGARLSRHLYDIHCIYKAKPACVADISLLSDVVKHKARYFFDKKANYEAAAMPGTLTLVPEGKIKDNFESDYANMDSMFYGEPPPTFSEIMDSLAVIQKRLNHPDGMA